MRYENRLTLIILAGGFPALALGLFLLWTRAGSSSWAAAAGWLAAAAWVAGAAAVRRRLVHPLRTLGGLLAGLRSGDYSARARVGSRDDALGELFYEANALCQSLSEQRRNAVEATALLRTVMAEIDVAVFTFDGERRLTLVNRAGENLLARPAAQILGRAAAELELADLLEDSPPRVMERSFPCGPGRWEVRVSTVWERGRAMRLLVVQNLTRALREEQIQSWKRLVRVLGHELNNSLTPIKSIADSLRTLMSRGVAAEDWKQDAEDGLRVIAGRADSLARFLEAYARLARLPQPQRKSFAVREWIGRVLPMETRLPVEWAEGPDQTVTADPDQLDQLLINLLRNAVDAALETGGGVRLGWKIHRRWLELFLEDEGPGLQSTGNLFVPFFTTKPGGSGIGLALSRQIAEAHGGQLTLENRSDRTGCRALLRLPL